MIKVIELAKAKEFLSLGLDIKKDEAFIVTVCNLENLDVFAVTVYMKEMEEGIAL